MSQPDPVGDDRFRVRRQRRATVTLAIVVLVLAGAFYYASTYFNQTAPTPTPCTTIVPTPQLQPRDVSIQVLNDTKKAGLAAATSKAAANRGFKIKGIGNDAKGETIKGVGELRFGPKGADSAKLLAQHIPGIKLVQDKRADDTVDLVLGTGWKAFGPVPTPTPEAPTLPQCPTVTITP